VVYVETSKYEHVSRINCLSVNSQIGVFSSGLNENLILVKRLNVLT